MEKLYNEMSRIEKLNYRQKLVENNESYCVGMLCNGKIKQLDEFSANNRNICKQCNNAQVKQSHKKNDRAYRREKTKLKVDNVCETCGCDDIELLEFDHKDPSDKTLTIGCSGSAKKLIKEADKTRFLCVWCHRLRTQKDIEDNFKKSKEDFEYSVDENVEQIDPLHSKKCKGEICNGRVRNYNKFYLMKNRYSTYCKKCSNYTGVLKRRHNADIVDNEKMKMGGCQLCDKEITKETLCCFDFDHLDQKTKKYNVADFRRLSGDKNDEILEEIAKCQLLCCNCHKKKTVKQLNYKTLDDMKDKLTISLPVKKESFICPVCNKNEMNERAKSCLRCYLVKRQPTQRPSFEILESEVAEHGFVRTGKKYNVTDNAIRKWLKWYIKNENKQLTKIQMKI